MWAVPHAVWRPVPTSSWRLEKYTVRLIAQKYPQLHYRSYFFFTTASLPPPLPRPTTPQGGDKYKEASLVYKDLLDRHGSSLVALNGLATAYLAMKRLDDAERLLHEALAKAPGDGDTLVNLIAVTQAQGRPGEAAGRHLPALREAHPEHPYLAQLDIVQGTFDRVAAAFAPVAATAAAM